MLSSSFASSTSPVTESDRSKGTVVETMKRSLSRDRSGNRISCWVYMWLVFVIGGQVVQNISAPLWHNRLPKEGHCADAFVMYLVMIVTYPVLFFVTSLACDGLRRHKIGSSLQKYLKYDEQRTIAMTGFCDALNGALVIPASPADKTPPIVGCLIGCTLLFPMIFIKHFYFGLKWRDMKGAYLDKWLLLAFVFYSSAGYLIMYPIVQKSDASLHDFLWWLVFFVGCIFGNFYNMQQEQTFKQWNIKTMPDYLGYLFWQTLWLCIFGHMLMFTDKIPGFGYAADDGLLKCLHDTWLNSFMEPALLYNMLFNFGYYFTYIGACYVNSCDALIGVIASSATTAIGIAISYPIDELTPDRSVVVIGLVPLIVVMSGGAMYCYTIWIHDKKPYDVVEPRREALLG